ncbi:MAG: hypothetical protein WBX25_21395, partial [Rhodomicrobium sp.]
MFFAKSKPIIAISLMNGPPRLRLTHATMAGQCRTGPSTPSFATDLKAAVYRSGGSLVRVLLSDCRTL